MINVLSLKEQAQKMDAATTLRVTTLVERFMREANIDFWLILAREYNEDPILNYLTLSKYPNARRLSCLMFYDDGEKVHRFNGGRPDPSLNLLYENTWKLEEETQWEGVKRVITECNPKVIGMNFSNEIALGDGLSKGIYDEFVREMNDAIIQKLVSADMLCVRFLETRTELEQEYYQVIAPVAEAIIRECYSKERIKPGVTTTADLEWFLEQRTKDLGLTCWFPPTIDVQRPGESLARWEERVIEKGDLVHCDFGIVYLGLCTDTQRLAYVAKDGETEVPIDLMKAMKENNRFQDIVTKNLVVGKTGNEVLLDSLEEGKKEGIRAILYSHPLGTHGHAAGPTIGLTNQQYAIPGKGDLFVYPNTNYALELTTIHHVPSFGGDVRMMTEETIQFDGETVTYTMSGRDEIIFV